jgi:hypothetical protein
MKMQMRTDFTTWDRKVLEKFARDAVTALAALQEDFKNLLEKYRKEVEEGKKRECNR